MTCGVCSGNEGVGLICVVRRVGAGIHGVGTLAKPYTRRHGGTEARRHGRGTGRRGTGEREPEEGTGKDEKEREGARKNAKEREREGKEREAKGMFWA